MTYWDLLLNSFKPSIGKQAEQKYAFASKEFITVFTKCAETIGAQNITSQLEQLDANYKSRKDSFTGS